MCTKYNNSKIFLCLMLTQLLFACSNSKNTINTIKQHDYSEEHYEKLGNNLNRLLEMRTGVFVQHLFADGKQELWRINDGQDSTITIARKVGIPSRDGHWILTYTFMTHAHDDPLSVTLEKYVPSPSSRDTIYCRFHNAPESITWEQISDEHYTFDNLDFKTDVQDRNQFITLAKQSLMEYTGPTNFREASLYADQFKLRQDFYTVRPRESRFLVSFFEEDENSPPNPFNAIQVLVKLPIKNKFFPNPTAYKDK